MRISDELVRVAERLSAALTRAGGALCRAASEFPADMRRVANTLVVADSKGSRRFDPDAPRFMGQNVLTLGWHTFTPDQVRTSPILNSDGKILGVNFPLKFSDSKDPLVFTHDGLESVRSEYYQAEKTRKLWPPKGLLPWKPKWSFGRSWPTSWANEGKDLVFARAHAHKDGYNIQVMKRIPFTKWSLCIPTNVDGKTYGQILASSEHFKQAVKAAPTAKLIQMSCSPAGGPAARASAESLDAAGIGFDVRATEKTHFTTFDRVSGSLVKEYGNIILGHGSEVELDGMGNPKKSPWAEYKASRIRPDTQD